MRHESIDALQRALADGVFHYANDRKKAAGRALGTIVELITYYVLRAWGLSDRIVIERRIPEFANPEITHNVEFSIHPLRTKSRITIAPFSLPITSSKIKANVPYLDQFRLRSTQIISKNRVKRNAAILVETDEGPIVANIDRVRKSRCDMLICQLSADPFAIVECKRVGVQEGMKRGPQTIEKAKQGSYVARSVSSLQKIRLRNGQFQGIIERADGKFYFGPYLELQRDIISKQPSSEFPGFVLTIGVVSNHGNWFTYNNKNKELLVLAQSYDWLLFLTDEGITRFVDDLILSPSNDSNAVRSAFLESYSGRQGENKFTKVRVDLDADDVMRDYFQQQEDGVTKWFNVISPVAGTLDALRDDLGTLASRSQVPRRT